eukprot:TRINITY_DN47092_c0_g1_i1.p1 TRINITY_DN47092_c0_g1~~TRINITY_DN47092_c0_g1_i1.p1  ORF type:complete len:1610 (+),score=192.54 TRINITY_DN47092_c0_g1_i1:78-4907(+)
MPGIAALLLQIGALGGDAADPQCAGAEVWRHVLENTNITLATDHSSEHTDQRWAAARENVKHAAAGNLVFTSCHGTAPCQKTCLLPAMAQTLLALAENGTVHVTSLAGGSHSIDSAHYRGLSVDIATYNGVALSRMNHDKAVLVMNACRAHGAAPHKMFNANRNCGSLCQAHANDVECQWLIGSEQACQQVGGFCWRKADSCTAVGGTTTPGLCSMHPEQRTCCVDVPNDPQCAAVKGVCQATGRCESEGGTWKAGLCGELPDEVRCCIPAHELPSGLLPGRGEGVIPRKGDSACTARGGLCYRDGKQACPWHWMQTADPCSTADGDVYICCAPHVADAACTARGGVCHYSDKQDCAAPRVLEAGLCLADRDMSYQCCTPSPKDAKCTVKGGSCGMHGHDRSSTCAAPREPREGLCAAVQDSAYTCCMEVQRDSDQVDSSRNATAASGTAAGMWADLSRWDMAPVYQSPPNAWETDDQLCERYNITSYPQFCDRSGDVYFHSWATQMSELHCPEQLLDASQWVRDVTHSGPGVQCFLCGRYWRATPYTRELVDLGKCAGQDKVVGLQRCCYNSAGVLPVFSFDDHYRALGVGENATASEIAAAAEAIGSNVSRKLQAVAKVMTDLTHREAYLKSRTVSTTWKRLRGLPWRGPPPVVGKALPRERRERCMCGAEEWRQRQRGGSEPADARSQCPANDISTPPASKDQMRAGKDGQVVHACLHGGLADIISGTIRFRRTPCPSELPLNETNIAIRLIIKFENFSSSPYNLSGTVHIGYGSTRKPDGSPWTMTDSPISKDQAKELLLRQILDKFWPILSNTIPMWGIMNPYMQGALLAFAYNLGQNFYGRVDYQTISTLLAKGPCEYVTGNNVGDLRKLGRYNPWAMPAREQMGWGDDDVTRFSGWDLVPHAMALYHMPKSPFARGLLRRRIAEGELFRRCGTSCGKFGDDVGETAVFQAAYASWDKLTTYWNTSRTPTDQQCLASGGMCMLQTECDQDVNEVRANLCLAPASAEKRCCIPRANDHTCIAQSGVCTKRSGCGSSSNIWRSGLCPSFPHNVRCCVPKVDDPGALALQQSRGRPGKVEGTHEWQCGPLCARITTVTRGDRLELQDRLGEWKGHSRGPHHVTFAHEEARRMDRGLLRKWDDFLDSLVVSCSTVPLHIKVVKGWSSQDLYPEGALYYAGRSLHVRIELRHQTGGVHTTCLNSIRVEAAHTFRFAALPPQVLQHCARGHCEDISSISRSAEERQGYFRILDPPGRFDSVVGGTTAVFVMFYAGWDAKAAALRPAWHRLSSHVFKNVAIRGKVQISSIDVTRRTSRSLVERFSLQGSPELHWFPKGSTHPAERFAGGGLMTEAQLFEYVNRKLGFTVPRASQRRGPQLGPFLDVHAAPSVPRYPDQTLPMQLFVCELEDPRGGSPSPDADQEEPPCTPVPQNVSLPGHLMLAAYGQPVPMVRLPDGLQGVPLFSTTPERHTDGSIDTSVLVPYLFFENGKVRQAVLIPGGPDGGSAGAPRTWTHAKGSWRRAKLLRSGAVPDDPAELCELHNGRVLVPPPSRFPAMEVLSSGGSPRDLPQQPGIVCIFDCGDDDCQSYAELRSELAVLEVDAEAGAES